MENKIDILLPEKIKNSIYVHPYINDTADVPRALIHKLPPNYGFLRLSPTYPADLTLVTQQHNNLGLQKRTIVVSSKTVGNIFFVSLFLNQETVFANLPQFSENRNLVLNLVQQSVYDPQNLHSEEQTLSAITIDKINQNNILNNIDFYEKHINKPDKINFPILSEILPLKNNICLLRFENNSMALISREQLLTASHYSSLLKPIESSPHKQKISDSLSQTFLSSPQQKRKADEDLNETSGKSFKSVENTEHNPASASSLYPPDETRNNLFDKTG